MIKKISLIIRLIRVKHWIKNLLVFLPLFFGGGIGIKYLLYKNICSFFAFCMIASSIYIINDIKDLQQDRCHITKCKRPLASGEISITAAVVVMIVLIFIGCILLVLSRPDSLILTILLLMIYFVVNVAYSFGCKNIPVLDVVLLASGFVIRVYFGTGVTGINVSEWLFMVILSGSLFMGLGKRRNELIKEGNKNTRKVNERYNFSFLTYNMYACMTIMIMFYALWCSNNKEEYRFIVYSIPLCIIIMMRYSYNIECSDSDGDPIEVLMNDKILIFLASMFIAVMCISVYANK